ncbi:MAG: FMN-binding protein, partial [Planctomycetales bacterium]|nr:FMN-binding protein [Planctomycetales bacterium]
MEYPRRATTHSRQNTAVHARMLQALRLTILCSVVGLIYFQHQAHLRTLAAQTSSTRLLPAVRQVLPTAHSLRESTTDDGTALLSVDDAQGNQLGWAAGTSPTSDHIIGFSGPTDVLLIFDEPQRLLQARLLLSRDTRDHVQRVVDSRLLTDLQGSSLSQLRNLQYVDGVSGATLTSLAVLESIRYRLRPQEPGVRMTRDQKSLKFQDAPRMEDIRRLFTAAMSLAPAAEPSRWIVRDERGQAIGELLRTSPAADNLLGYQGPTDTLLALDPAGKVTGATLGATYDNEPYVDYIRRDNYFRQRFNELTLSELAAMDLQAEGIEGVSGATMTSMAMAEGIVAAAAAAERQAASRQAARQAADSHRGRWPVSLRNASTCGLVLLGLVFGLTRWKRARRLRILFQCLLIGWLGLVNGDMLSQAMWVGWAQSGVPVQNALGLVCLTAVALLVPLSSGQNIYCAHLCPHGAVQQLLRNRLPWRWSIPRRLDRLLRWLPLALLLWVLAVALLHLPFSLVDIEPFDAWLWTISGGAAIAIAVVGLGCSLFTPMA